MAVSFQRDRCLIAYERSCTYWRTQCEQHRGGGLRLGRRLVRMQHDDSSRVGGDCRQAAHPPVNTTNGRRWFAASAFQAADPNRRLHPASRACGSRVAAAAIPEQLTAIELTARAAALGLSHAQTDASRPPRAEQVCAAGGGAGHGAGSGPARERTPRCGRTPAPREQCVDRDAQSPVLVPVKPTVEHV
jgi:hypothetical protein